MEPVMYVLVRQDLSKSQQAVQAGHAVARYLLYHPNSNWLNGTLVYLRVSDLEELGHWCQKLKDFGIGFSVFTEPDLDYEITALAVVTEYDLFRDLMLL